MIVYTFGARWNTVGEDLREQMRLGREYYNAMVEAENARRQAAWGGEHPPAPPHPAEDDDAPLCRCDACKAHWKAVCESCYGRIDKKPLRSMFTALGMYRCAYHPAEAAFDAACKTTRLTRLVAYRSWRQGGQLELQITRTCWEHGLANRYYAIDATDDKRKGRRARHGGRRLLRMRIGSDDEREPSWSSPVAFEQHRPILGRVTWVGIRIWYDEETEKQKAAVRFTCNDEPARTDLAVGGAVAVDVSWRKVLGGLRVAYTRDDQGQQTQFVLGSEWLHLTKHADGIRSTRDAALNALKEQDARFSAVKSPRGARRLVRQMSEDAEGAGADARAWLRRDLHLLSYEQGERNHSVTRRREELRRWARDLRRHYQLVIVKDSQHKAMKEEKTLPRPARRQGQHAAPGEVIAVLREVFGDANMCVVKAVDTTDTCPDCGHLNDHGPETMVVCEQCGTTHDRDDASTRNMMVLWAAEEWRPPTARKKKAKFASRHVKHEEPPQCQLDGR